MILISSKRVLEVGKPLNQQFSRLEIFVITVYWHKQYDNVTIWLLASQTFNNQKIQYQCGSCIRMFKTFAIKHIPCLYITGFVTQNLVYW